VRVSDSQVRREREKKEKMHVCMNTPRLDQVLAVSPVVGCQTFSMTLHKFSKSWPNLVNLPVNPPFSGTYEARQH